MARSAEAGRYIQARDRAIEEMRAPYEALGQALTRSRKARGWAPPKNIGKPTAHRFSRKKSDTPTRWRRCCATWRARCRHRDLKAREAQTS